MGILKQEVEEVALSERTYVGCVTNDCQTQFQASDNRNDREMRSAASPGCVAAAVNEHGLNHELMNDSSRGLAEVGSIRERCRSAPFTAAHYLN